MEKILLPPGNGEPEIGVNAPVVGSTEKPDIPVPAT
jgi:hypothetical protein